MLLGVTDAALSRRNIQQERYIDDDSYFNDPVLQESLSIPSDNGVYYENDKTLDDHVFSKEDIIPYPYENNEIDDEENNENFIGTRGLPFHTVRKQIRMFLTQIISKIFHSHG